MTTNPILSNARDTTAVSLPVNSEDASPHRQITSAICVKEPYKDNLACSKVEGDRNDLTEENTSRILNYQSSGIDGVAEAQPRFSSGSSVSSYPSVRRLLTLAVNTVTSCVVHDDMLQ